MTKHTEKAVKAAEEVLLKYDSNSDDSIIESVDDWSAAVDGAAAIIDQVTGLPEITAERDRLREALREIKERQFIQMLCPTAPSKDGADGFKLGAQQATMECVRIAGAILAKVKPESGEKEEPK